MLHAGGMLAVSKKQHMRLQPGMAWLMALSARAAFRGAASSCSSKLTVMDIHICTAAVTAAAAAAMGMSRQHLSSVSPG